MKKYGTLIALGLAVVCGAAAVWLTSQWMAKTEGNRSASEPVPLVNIVIAAQDLETGTLLTTDNLTMAQWPKPTVPKGIFEKIEDVAGRVAVTPLAAGQPLRAAELAEPGSGAGMVAMIPPGKRAMSLKVNEVSGVSGFILPNTYVDVIAVDSRSGRGREVSAQEVKTILKKIKVLAIAQETTNEKGKPKVVKTVTMEVTPKEAETLALYSVYTTIHLILRNPLEDVEEQVAKVEPPVKRTAVAKVKPKPVAVAAAEPPPTPTAPTYAVEVIKGSKSPEQIKFKSVNSDERLDAGRTR